MDTAGSPPRKGRHRPPSPLACKASWEAMASTMLTSSAHGQPLVSKSPDARPSPPGQGNMTTPRLPQPSRPAGSWPLCKQAKKVETPSGFCPEPQDPRSPSLPSFPALWCFQACGAFSMFAARVAPQPCDACPCVLAPAGQSALSVRFPLSSGHSSGGGHYARKSQTLRSKQGTRPGIIRPSPAPTLPGVPDDPSAVSTKQSGEQQPLLQEPEPSQGPSIPSGSPSRSAVDQRPSLSSVDQMVKSEAGLQKLFAPGPSWKKRRMDGLAGSMEDNVHGSIRSLLESRASKLVVDPRSPSFMLWDVCITMVVAYTALLVPYEVGLASLPAPDCLGPRCLQPVCHHSPVHRCGSGTGRPAWSAMQTFLCGSSIVSRAYSSVLKLMMRRRLHAHLHTKPRGCERRGSVEFAPLLPHAPHTTTFM